MTENIEPRQGAFFPIEGSSDLGRTSVTVDSHGNPWIGRLKQLDEARINCELAHLSLMKKISLNFIENAGSLRGIGELMEGIREASEESLLASKRYAGMLSEETRRFREEVKRITTADGLI